MPNRFAGSANRVDEGNPTVTPTALSLAPTADKEAGRLAERLLALRQVGGFTVATAESCTGGLVGALITAVPGSSAYYLGGVVSYANSAKTSLLGVDAATLDRFGAVSEETAREMAIGARLGLGADFALSITGIAGPDGGTVEKPAGLVYIGVATPRGALVRRHLFAGDRRAVRAQAAAAALRWLVDAVEDEVSPSS